MKKKPENIKKTGKSKVSEDREASLKAEIEELKGRVGNLEKEKLKLEQANILKSQFLASMSHELRSPLNAIYGYIQFLKKMHYEQHSFVFEHIVLCQNHLMDTLRKLIDISRLHSNQFPYHPEYCNISKILSDTILTIEILALQKSMAITFNCDDTDIYCYADPYALSHAFLNIIDNAIKYTEKEKGHIMVDVRRYNDNIVIEFTDKGVGISEDQIPILFDEFSNEIRPLKRRAAGSGIGMPLTKKLVEACGGTISVKSKKNYGTTVTISLPEARADKGKKISYTEISQPEAPNIKGLVNILVTENEPLTQQYLQMNLKQYNYNVYKAFTTDQIFSIIENYKIDILILDLSTIGSDKDIIGLRKDKKLKKVQVIALAEPKQIKDKKKLTEQFDAIVQKPVNMSKLTAQISRLFHE
jgi:nitrogen-specific signal transduction histidine kinase/CheY-like chemotaxis protein